MKNNIKLPKLNNIKIFRNAYYWFILPIAIIFIALVCGTVYSTEGNKYDGFANIGIDFKGGTVLTVQMDGADIQGANRNDVYNTIKEIVENNGAKISTDQNSGDNAIVVRYPNSINGVDYNESSKTEEMISINNTIIEQVETALKAKYSNASSVIASAEMINATASDQLINKALLSVGIAMVLMLIYIAIRFDFFSGIAALCASFTDIIVMLALVITFRIQINSSLIAGLITVVAYSINNTIVIFDRVREHKKEAKDGRLNVENLVDQSVSECFVRTFLSSFTTLITITILACWGIKSLTDFALPIIFGIMSGLYSSLFVAPSIWGLLMNAKLGKSKKARKQAKNRRR
ncbi:MAG: protein translocase subunit SecF [Clostridia bacterium]|nr:protein translocase subunit SecF [Clostridia bacterium]